MTLFDWHNSENAAVNPAHSSGSLNPVIVPACACGCVYVCVLAYQKSAFH